MSRKRTAPAPAEVLPPAPPAPPARAAKPARPAKTRAAASVRTAKPAPPAPAAARRASTVVPRAPARRLAAPEATPALPPEPAHAELPPAPQELAPTAASARMANAYDQGLLDRAREQWRRGDWASLQELAPGEIEQHPDRARLALLAAAGHHAAGQRAAARLFAQRAAEWGCDRTLIARVLIGGVHNTLARAAVATGRQRERALRHFEQAVAAGAPGSTGALATQARIEHQVGLMGLATELPQLRAATTLTGRAPMLANPLKEIGEQLRKQSDALAASLKTQHDDLASVRKALESTVKREVLNATKQLEAFVNLQGYLAKGVVVPEMHGWPVSPDFALLLVQMLEATDYDLVIEFGSGSSTALMATVLTRNAARRQGRPRAVQVAFEHLERFHAETASLLAAGGLTDAVDLELAPLVPYAAPNGKTYPYYDCRPALTAIAQTMGPPESLRIFVLVDGPPAATGEHARYPALPVVLEHFGGARLDVVLDDYIRDDEKQIAKLWMAELAARGLSPTMTEKKMEKDACVVVF